MNTQQLKSEECCMICNNTVTSNKFSKCEKCSKIFHTECNIYPEEVFIKNKLCDICRVSEDIPISFHNEFNIKTSNLNCLLCKKSEGILFNLGKKIHEWVHIACIKWFEYKIEKDEKDFYYVSSTQKNFFEFLSSECSLCKKTIKTDFLINCRVKENGFNCQNNYYHRECISNHKEYKDCVEKFYVKNNLIYYVFRCPDHDKKHKGTQNFPGIMTSCCDVKKEISFNPRLTKITEEKINIDHNFNSTIQDSMNFNKHFDSNYIKNKQVKEDFFISYPSSNNENIFPREEPDRNNTKNNRMKDLIMKDFNSEFKFAVKECQKEMEGFSMMKNYFNSDNSLKEERDLLNSTIKTNSNINMEETCSKSFTKVSFVNNTQITQNIINSNSHFEYKENFRNKNIQNNIQKSSNSVFDCDVSLIENLSKSISYKIKNLNKSEKNKEEITANKNSHHNNHLIKNDNYTMNIESNLKYSFYDLNIKEKCDICTKDLDEGILYLEESANLKCKTCEIIIHKSCNNETEFIREDRCNKCLAESRNPQISIKNSRIKCYACEKTQGSMINVNCKWIHFLCLSSFKKLFYNTNNNNNYENESIDFKGNDLLNAFEKIQKAKANDCNICNKRSNFALKCNGCNFYSHAYCAFLHNLENLKEKKLTKLINIPNEENKNNNIFRSALTSNLRLYNINSTSINSSKNITLNYLNGYEFEIKCNQKHSAINSKAASSYEIKRFDNRFKDKDSCFTKVNKECKDKQYNSRIILNNDSNYNCIQLNTNSNKKTIDNNGRIKDCVNNNGHYNKTSTYELNSLKYNNEIKNSQDDNNENKTNRLQANTLSKRNSERDFNKEKDKILENDKINFNYKSKLEKHSQKEKERMRKNTKSLKTNFMDKELSLKDSFENIYGDSKYFAEKDLVAGKNSIYGEKKKYNNIISANLRENIKENKGEIFNYEQNIKSLNMKYLKEKFNKLKSLSLIDLYDKNISEEELIEHEKKHFSSWEFVKDYFKKLELEDLEKIKFELSESKDEDEYQIFDQFIRFWFAQNKKEEPKFQNDSNLFNLKTIPEEKNMFIKCYNLYQSDKSSNKTDKFLRIKRNSRVCRVRKNNADLILLFEILSFCDLYQKCLSQDKEYSNRLTAEFELNELSKLGTYEQTNNYKISEEGWKKVSFFSNRSFQKSFNQENKIMTEIEKETNIVENEKTELGKEDKNLKCRSLDDLSSDKNVLRDEGFYLNKINPADNDILNNLNKANIVENISLNDYCNPNIIISKCLDKLIINKSILNHVPSNINAQISDDFYKERRKICNSIKLIDLFQIKSNEQRAFDLQESAIRNIQDSFSKFNKCNTSTPNEDSREEATAEKNPSNFLDLSLDALNDIDRLILINDGMLKKLTNDNKLTINSLLDNIKAKILYNKNQILEKLIRQTKSFKNVLIYENNEDHNHNERNEFSSEIIDLKKIKEIDKIFYLPFTSIKNEDAIDIAELKKFEEISKDVKIFIGESSQSNDDNTNPMEIDEKHESTILNVSPEGIINYNNPGIIEIKNYDIMEEENFDLINNSFLTEYYSYNRFNQIKRRLKLGFRDKNIETIIKSRFTSERLSQIIGEHSHERLADFNLIENQSDQKFERIMDGLKKSDSDCCICMYSELDDTSVIVFCDCCNVGMHLECYGISNVDEIYLCDVCVYILKNFGKINFSLKNKEFIGKKHASDNRLFLADSISEPKIENNRIEEGQKIKKSNSIIQIDLTNDGFVNAAKDNLKNHNVKRGLRLGKHKHKHSISEDNAFADVKISNNKLKLPFDFNEHLMENFDNLNQIQLNNSIFDMDVDYDFNQSNESKSNYVKKDNDKEYFKDKSQIMRSRSNLDKKTDSLIKKKNSFKESENKNANSILNHVKCVICCQSRGPMKNINPDEGDWAHIICLIFSINYQIYDYGKILVNKVSSNDNYKENFINNYSFYFKQHEDLIAAQGKKENGLILPPLDFYKSNQKEDCIIKCEICTSSTGEVFPCLCCLEQRKLQNDKIPHFHVLCAYLNGNKMEVLENEEKISYENYYNFFLKREKLDKYLIKRSRIYAKINCAYHSLDGTRNPEIQKRFRNLVYHKETFLYKDFKNKFQQNKKEKNNSFKRKKSADYDNDTNNFFGINNSTKKSLTNYGLKQSDNSTEDQSQRNKKSKNDRTKIIKADLMQKLEQDDEKVTHDLERDNLIDKLMEQKGILLIYKENSNRFLSDNGKPNQLSPEENINQKFKFLDFYLQNTQTVDLYDEFCYDPKFSNFCKACFEEFKDGEQMKVDCISCKISFHYNCYSDDNLRTKINILCDFCSNHKNKKRENQKPTCMLCPNKGGAVRKVSMNIPGLKTIYNEFDIFWSHNYCGKKLNLKCTKKKFDGLLQKIPFLNKYNCDICGLKRGFVVKCAVKNCNKLFHLSCAKIKNLKNIIDYENFNYLFCEYHTILDWYTRDNRIHEKIALILSQLENLCNIKNKNDYDKESYFNNDDVAIEMEINTRGLDKKEDILWDINNNIELRTQIFKINGYINSKKEQLFSDDLITPRLEDYPSMLFLYILELPIKIFECIIGQILSKESFTEEEKK